MTETDSNKPIASRGPTEKRAAQPIPRHTASELMERGTLAHIDHDEQTYTLRITRAGKLILTK